MGILDNSVHREILGVKRDELINTCTEFKILSLKPLINLPCYKAINVYCKQRIQIGRKNNTQNTTKWSKSLLISGCIYF